MAEGEGMNKKLNDKYLELMKKAGNDRDTEKAHINADDLLCRLLIELGYKDVVDEYVEIEKWYA
jgi:predicted GNAT family N-acyltransferase